VETADRPSDELDAAIHSAHECLRRLFHAEDGDDFPNPSSVWRSDRAGKTEVGGFWCGELEADTTLESDYILFLYLLDPRAYRNKIRKLANYVLRQQLDDGSWNIFYDGQGEISASVKAYVALRLAGHSADEPCLQRARDAILRMGGAEKANSYTKIYLSLLNLYSWGRLPALPPELVLLPRFFYFNIYEISYWSRAILIPLSILYAKWPVSGRVVSGDVKSIDELFVDPPAHGSVNGNGTRALGSNGNGNGNGNGSSNGNGTRRNGNGSRHGQLISWRSFFSAVNGILKLVEKAPLKPLRSIALRKAEQWMVHRLQDSDGLGAIFPSMVNSVLAMQCLGYASDHPLIIEGLEKLYELEIEDGDEIRLQPCLSPVWDTALAMNALGESGFAADSEQMIEAGRWLVSKEVRRPGDWQKRVRDAEVSGWPFQFRNDFYPDIDDTAAVIMALGRIVPDRVPGIAGAMERGLNWMVSLQCSNGGWAAFDADVEREVFNQVPYADHNAMLDPACADITGRVLEMFGRLPRLRRYAKVRRAIRNGIRYLKDAQEENGSWYGRWGVNYIYGTWQALKGLMEVGEAPSQPYIRKAVEFLVSRQNADGGWGETCATYDDPELAGRGPSTASQTAWALMGMIAAGETESPVVERGMKYLLSHQGADGNWEEEHWTGTGFPSVFYLKYHLYRLYFPLFALGMYKNARTDARSVLERLDLDLDRAPRQNDVPNGANGRRTTAVGGSRRLRSLFGLLG